MTILLVVDTCALLDLVRAPVRAEFHPSYANGACRLLAALQSAKPPCRLVCSDVVQTEYRRNIDAVTDETRRLLYKNRDQYRQGLKIVGYFSGANELPSVDDAWIEASVLRARGVADRFAQIAAVEPATADDMNKAVRRVMTGTAPSRQGKDSTADCIITEVALRLANAGASGVTRTVFFSSNTAEYCETQKLKSSLQAEFDAIGIEYVRNWGEATASVFNPSAAAIV
jgi:PIN domain